MDALLEINNDMRFEHFIDESLDIDMSAVSMLPPLQSESKFNFFDEIMTAGSAARLSKPISPSLEFATHEYLVRLSPETKKPEQTISKLSKSAGKSMAIADATVFHQFVKVEPESSTSAGTSMPIADQTGFPQFVKVEPIEEGSRENQIITPTAIKSEPVEGSHQFLVPPAKKKAAAPRVKMPPVEFMCHRCNDRFSSHVEVEKHYRTKYNTDPIYKCHRCNKEMSNLTSFRTHYRRHTSDRLPCTVCPRFFHTQSDLDEHSRTHTTELRLVCSYCQMSFIEFDQYTSHVRSHRNADRKTSSSPTKWKCPQCGKLLKNRSSLTKHAKIHLEERQYPCSVCPTTFVQKINYINHVKVVHGCDKPFACDECDKCFVGKSQLLRHMQYHINVRAFKCETCLKMYKTERNLKMHSLVHFEQRPHVCSHCGKSFLSSSKLKQHSNVHTGARPFKCKYCAKDFTNFPNWLKHVRRLHKVDHKTGEHLDALPSFLIRPKKAPKEVSTQAPGTANASTTKRTKAAQKDVESRPKETKTSKKNKPAVVVSNTSSIDLDDTNALSFEPLPLDLQSTSASIQLHHIDLDDMKQIQQLLPANEESFASIEDAQPHSNHPINFIKEENSIHFDDTPLSTSNTNNTYSFHPTTATSFLNFINQSDIRLPKEENADMSFAVQHSTMQQISTNVQ